ncbi:MAG: hypothetical protein IPN53_15260 [Comamonadaceae bacterium]|nr:hypothetical protein [Comamonadaceae bacterium]
MSATDLSCPICGTTLSMEHLLINADDRAAVLRLISFSTSIGASVGQYIRLFDPPKTRLTMRKQVRIVLQLLPDIERRAITHRGRDWAVPLAVWEAGIDQMLQARDAGRLDLPMKGHGYLYAILVALADKAEASVEAQSLATARSAAPRQDTVTVRGQPMPMGQALAQVYGGRDPALARLDAEAGTAAPMPDAVRAKLAALKNSGAKPSC